MIIQPKFKESLVIPNLENCINLVNNNNSFVSKIENIGKSLTCGLVNNVKFCNVIRKN